MKVRHEVDRLFDAIDKGDHVAVRAAAKVLATQALTDLNRIANALETLASPPLGTALGAPKAG